MQIEGQAAIVTGGASGLGLATATRLLAEGARVTILDRSAEQGRALADGIGAHFVAADVTDEAAVAGALDDAQRRNGAARILVNCAGIAPPAKVIARDGTPQPLAEFSRTIAVNLIGTFNVLAQFAARIAGAEPVGEERGVVINTASVAAFEGQIGQAAYAASKGGVAAMTLPVAREFARHGIRVMAIAPGLFMTPMLAALPPEVQDSLGRQVPFPARLGRPEEYAELAVAIIRNPMLNGETIRLDGAIRMAPK